MFSDNDILKQTAKTGFSDEEWFDIMLKIAQSTIAFDLVDVVDMKITESNDNNKTTNIDNKENTLDDLRSDYYTLVI
jgi:hypothetical protein